MAYELFYWESHHDSHKLPLPDRLSGCADTGLDVKSRLVINLFNK